MADKNYILKFTMSDGSEKTVQFSVPQGENGKTAYQYAQEAGYTGTEAEFAAKLSEEWQGKLHGIKGQVVGFDANGNAVAQEAPSGGSGGTSEPVLDVTLSSEEMAELTSTIADLKALKKANTSVVAFLTDPHMAGWTVTKIEKAVYGYNKISEAVKTDLLLLGGDYLDNSPTTTKEQALAWYSDLRDVLSYRNAKVPAAVIKGNHDDNTMYTDYANGLIDFETFWSALGDIDADKTVRNAGNIEDCYGYYDIPNQKVRVFYVNTVDIPQEYIELTNSVTYKGQYDTGISIKQLQFIADHLKFDTPGWHVMVFSHHPLMRDIAIENGCGVQADRGGAALLELLDKFNSGNTSGSITVTATDFAGTVSYDFTANVDCKIVACINGHTHRDSVDIYNESFMCISVRGVYGHPSYDGHISSSAYFVVDRNNEKLHLLYNGDGEENVFDYATLGTGGEEPGEPVYVEIVSPFEWEIGQVDGTTGDLIGDSYETRIHSTEIIGFTTPAIIDMSASSILYDYYLYDLDGKFVGTGNAWTESSVPFTLPNDKTVRFKVRKSSWGTWSSDDINAFANNIKVYVEEGGEAYTPNGSVPDEPDEPETQIQGIAVGGSIYFNSSRCFYESSNVRRTIVATEGEHSLYISNSSTLSQYYLLTIPDGAKKVVTVAPSECAYYGVMIMSVASGNDYTRDVDSGWMARSSETAEYSIPSAYADGKHCIGINFKTQSGGAFSADFDNTKISLEFIYGKPPENVLYVTGGSAADGAIGMDIYQNAPRMTALATSGVKPVADPNNLCEQEAYFIAIPAEATKIKVTCPSFIPGLQFLKYENDAYTKLADPGWQSLNGCEYSFTAGQYTHVAINYKNSSNSNIPTDTDTSGFSIVFE